jgi:hypothetical protein
LATAYAAGPSLADAVSTSGPLPPASVLSLAAALAEALGAIHAAGLVHRDLKPPNVLLAEDGPRVIDFGISRAAEASALTRPGPHPGTSGFMSPEQVEGKEVGPASDVFSLGAVLVFAATGAPPFGTGSTADYLVVHGSPRLDGVPSQVRPIAERCLAKDPGQRPTPAELLAKFGDVDLAASWLPTVVLKGWREAEQRAAREAEQAAKREAGQRAALEAEQAAERVKDVTDSQRRLVSLTYLLFPVALVTVFRRNKFIRVNAIRALMFGLFLGVAAVTVFPAYKTSTARGPWFGLWVALGSTAFCVWFILASFYSFRVSLTAMRIRKTIRGSPPRLASMIDQLKSDDSWLQEIPDKWRSRDSLSSLAQQIRPFWDRARRRREDRR